MADPWSHPAGGWHPTQSSISIMLGSVALRHASSVRIHELLLPKLRPRLRNSNGSSKLDSTDCVWLQSILRPGQPKSSPTSLETPHVVTNAGHKSPFRRTPKPSRPAAETDRSDLTFVSR